MEDSFGELPEHILSHILSFLPTKEAVRTSILSKRWKFIWTSIPELHFFYDHRLEVYHSFDTLHTNFSNMVDRSLQLRESTDITSFSLRIGAFHMSKVEEWISDVVRFNVKSNYNDTSLG